MKKFLRPEFILMFVCGATTQLLAEGLGIEVYGTLQKRLPNGAVQPWTTFHARSFGEVAAVSNYYFNGESLVNGTDGTNSFFLNTMAVAAKLDPQAWKWGAVTDGPFPVADLTPGQLCWAAFALTSNSVAKARNLPFEAFQQNTGLVRSVVAFATNPPYLPTRIQWFGSNVWAIAGTKGNDLISLRHTNGFLAGEYRVVALTNLGGLEVPISFELNVFLPCFGPQQLAITDVTLVEALQGSVERVVAISNLTNPRPALGGRAQIAHFRLSDGSGDRSAILTRLNGRWPQETDADFLQAAQLIKLERQGTENKAVLPRRWFGRLFVIGCMALATVALLIALARKQANP